MRPRIAVIIVNYKGREDTLACLSSLQAVTYQPISVYLVDQASDDGTPEAVREKFPTVKIFENPVNNGFAGGNNIGLRAALADGAEYAFLLNNDTSVAPDIFENLLEVLQEEANVGIVGPLMLYDAEPEMIWSSGGQMGPWGESVQCLQGRPMAEAVGRPSVDFIVGCGLLVRRAVLEQIGLLDERFFLYYEEADFCARARSAGWQIRTESTGHLWHKVSRTTGTDSLLTLYYMRRNVLLYLRNHSPRPRGAVTRATYDSLRLATVWTLQGKMNRAIVLLRAVADFFLGRFGPARFPFR